MFKIICFLSLLFFTKSIYSAVYDGLSFFREVRSGYGFLPESHGVDSSYKISIECRTSIDGLFGDGLIRDSSALNRRLNKALRSREYMLGLELSKNVWKEDEDEIEISTFSGTFLFGRRSEGVLGIEMLAFGGGGVSKLEMPGYTEDGYYYEYGSKFGASYFLGRSGFQLGGYLGYQYSGYIFDIASVSDNHGFIYGLHLGYLF